MEIELTKKRNTEVLSRLYLLIFNLFFIQQIPGEHLYVLARHHINW